MPDILIYEDHEMDELFSIVNEEKIFFILNILLMERLIIKDF